MSDFYQSKSDRELLLTTLRKLDALHDTLESLSGQTNFVFQQAKRHQPSITSITIRNPNGDTVTMSGTNPPSTAVALLLPTPGSGYTAGSAIVQLNITNSDGTAPTLQFDQAQAGLAILAGTPTVTANPAGSPSPYQVELTAGVAGSTNVSVLADGVVDCVIAVTVSASPLEQVSIGTVVVTPPQPPAAPPAAA